MSCRASAKNTGALDTGQASISMSRESMVSLSACDQASAARVVAMSQHNATATATPTTCWVRVQLEDGAVHGGDPAAAITNQMALCRATPWMPGVLHEFHRDDVRGEAAGERGQRQIIPSGDRLPGPGRAAKTNPRASSRPEAMVRSPTTMRLPICPILPRSSVTGRPKNSQKPYFSPFDARYGRAPARTRRYNSRPLARAH